MKRTLRNIVGGLGLLTLVAGCTPAGAVLMGSRDPGARVVGTFMYHEGAHQDRMEEAREGRSQVNVYGNQEGVSYEDSWKGTAVVNRIENKDGTIVFILDAIKAGKTIDSNYADMFLDASKYDKNVKENGPYGLIIKYLPKNRFKSPNNSLTGNIIEQDLKE